MLSQHLAQLYGVPVKVLNQAVQRNLDRFPLNFMFQLDAQEFAHLKSQIVTSNIGRGGRRYQDKGETQYVTALEIPPVESPTTVVRAAILAEEKGKK